MARVWLTSLSTASPSKQQRPVFIWHSICQPSWSDQRNIGASSRSEIGREIDVSSQIRFPNWCEDFYIWHWDLTKDVQSITRCSLNYRSLTNMLLLSHHHTHHRHGTLVLPALVPPFFPTVVSRVHALRLRNLTNGWPQFTAFLLLRFCTKEVMTPSFRQRLWDRWLINCDDRSCLNWTTGTKHHADNDQTAQCTSRSKNDDLSWILRLKSPWIAKQQNCTLFPKFSESSRKNFSQICCIPSAIQPQKSKEPRDRIRLDIHPAIAIPALHRW